ncbi:MAG: SPFH domain-containing protein, partial [Ruminiclostridium sp.]|nr:SPFH domain-containing protein [Ruminiclostridium sp.]
MGLIKALTGALGGELADSWKEAIHCEAMGNNVILRNGRKMNQNSSRTSNTKGTENVISNGSVIMVEENTCMLTLDNGKITNIVTEPGRYTLDNSSAPSIFAGQIKDSAKDFLQRFTFGGTPGVEQRVVYINLQRLPGIRFGTGAAVPYFDPKYNTSIDLRFFGTFEIQIPDAEYAVKFYQQVASKGVSSSDMTVTSIFDSQQYKQEFIQAMTEALGMLSTQNISYSQISTQLSLLTENVQKATLNNWQERGFVVTNIGMGAPTLTDESKKLLGDRLKADTMLDPNVQKAMMAGSVARGIEAAGANEGGAMMGFMGMNMAQQAGGNILGQMDMAAQQYNQQQAQAQAQANSWKCSCGTMNTGAFCSSCGNKKPEPWTCSCGAQNTGKFCANCGASKEGTPTTPKAPTEWTCSCGKTNTGKFCAECGSPKPAAPKKYKCDKCGWEPADPSNPPKFCPECGDPFNEDDLV